MVVEFRSNRNSMKLQLMQLISVIIELWERGEGWGVSGENGLEARNFGRRKGCPRVPLVT